MATSRRCGGTRVTSRPSNQTLPALGVSSPAISRNNVLLPEPDGPSTTSSSPALMVKSNGWSAAIPPGKSFASCRSSIWANGDPQTAEGLDNLLAVSTTMLNFSLIVVRCQK